MQSTQGPRWQRIVVIVIALLVTAALVLPATFGHAELRSSNPAQGASVAMAEEVVLTFNEPISPDFVQIAVNGPDGDVIGDLPSVNAEVVTQPIEPTSNGNYVLSYRVISADGHPVTGEISFTLTDVPAAEPTEEATGAATATATADDTATSTSTATATEDATTEDAVTEEPTATEAATPISAVTDEAEHGFPWLMAAVAFLGAGLVTWLLLRLYLSSRDSRESREH